MRCHPVVWPGRQKGQAGFFGTLGPEQQGVTARPEHVVERDLLKAGCDLGPHEIRYGWELSDLARRTPYFILLWGFKDAKPLAFFDERPKINGTLRKTMQECRRPFDGADLYCIMEQFRLLRIFRLYGIVDPALASHGGEAARRCGRGSGSTAQKTFDTTSLLRNFPQWERAQK